MKEHIHQSNLIEDIDSEKEDTQSMKAWEWLARQTYVSHKAICYVQKMITQNQKLFPDERGEYRHYNVRVGSRVCPSWADVSALTEDWLEEFKHSKYPIEAHIKFEHIHPFVDGNGRTGRMLLWWHQINLDEVPTLFQASEREDYYKLFD